MILIHIRVVLLHVFASICESGVAVTSAATRPATVNPIIEKEYLVLHSTGRPMGLSHTSLLGICQLYNLAAG